jgi:dephospho-CoA kinase
MIIGLTGKNGSGKTEICKYLESKGFKYYSLSDILREELTKRGQEITRENLIKLGNELREKFGAGILAVKLLEKIGKGNYCIDSIRNPKEIEEFRKRKDFFLVGVEASIELRYQRIQKRQREEDKISFEEFKRLEELENSNSDFGQQIDKCMEMADIIINNDGTIEELYEKVNYLVEYILKN